MKFMSHVEMLWLSATIQEFHLRALAATQRRSVNGIGVLSVLYD